jgi:hypothetical protein
MLLRQQINVKSSLLNNQNE